MSSLYEIQRDIAKILDAGFIINEETGEVIADTSDLDALILAEEEKLENCICYLKNLISEATAIKEEERALCERRRAKEARAERLKDYIANSMKASNRGKFETPRCRASFRSSKAVEINESVFYETAAPQFIRIKKEPDKAVIKAALAAGTPVMGAAIVEKESLQVK